MSDITLSEDELRAVTGYKRPRDQLAELHRQGFYRARLSTATGGVIVERTHYDAVCTGRGSASNDARPGTPKLRAIS